ncbi:MAG: hypothetical protein E7J78_04935 [Pantoea sp.]|nr:hypothetical protein [Pantoea sp.]
MSVIGFSYVLSASYFATIALADRATEALVQAVLSRQPAICPAESAVFTARSLFICACSQRCNFTGGLFDFIFLLK